MRPFVPLQEIPSLKLPSWVSVDSRNSLFHKLNISSNVPRQCSTAKLAVGWLEFDRPSRLRIFVGSGHFEITHGPQGPGCLFFNLNFLLNKSFIRYAALHCSGTARSPALTPASQLGGMRFGFDQAPSRIFLSAMLSAMETSKRRSAPCSTAQRTCRRISGAAFAGTASRMRFRVRARSKTVRRRGPT
jgi:hypothetical protein